MPRIVSCPAAAFVVGVVLAVALIGGVVMAGVVSLEFGAESGEAAPKPLKTAFARVTATKNANGKYFEKSRGVVDVLAKDSDAARVYCFDLSFVPKVAAVSPFFTNDATVAVWLPGQSASTGCPPSHSDAAAKTYAGDTSLPVGHVSFNIIFHA
jgi:hypothetical protein